MEENIQTPTPQVSSTPPSPATPIATPLNSSSLPPSTKRRGNGIAIVAVILICLAVILGILYYFILKQSLLGTSQQTPSPTMSAQKPSPSLSPTTIPSTTTEEKDIQNIQVTDPSSDINQINKDANGL